MMTRDVPPLDVRICRSCTEFRRRQVILSQPDRLPTSVRRNPATRMHLYYADKRTWSSPSPVLRTRLCLANWADGPGTVLGASTSSTDDLPGTRPLNKLRRPTLPDSAGIIIEELDVQVRISAGRFGYSQAQSSSSDMTANFGGGE